MKQVENHGNPLVALNGWIEEARRREVPQPASAALITASASGQPSARTVTLKRLEADALVFTTALWTRKAAEIAVNPQTALLLHWPSLGRQAHVAGNAVRADRALDEELWRERPLAHQLQAIVSRQGETIEDLDPLRARLAHLAEVQETPPLCPEDWGAIRIQPDAIELWQEAPDRLHERRLYEREGDRWKMTLLSP
ncbi:MAG: pyridoxine/pyridoxamine 5'-phosphate oxidase [Solirubrobacterales bacterium]